MLKFIIFFFRIVDNLPCATQFKMIDSDEIQYEHGYKLGFVKDGKVRSTKITDRSSGDSQNSETCTTFLI